MVRKENKKNISKIVQCEEKVLVLEYTYPTIEILANHLGRISCYLEDPKYENIPLSWEKIKEYKVPALRYCGHNFSL